LEQGLFRLPKSSPAERERDEHLRRNSQADPKWHSPFLKKLPADLKAIERVVGMKDRQSTRLSNIVQ